MGVVKSKMMTVMGSSEYIKFIGSYSYVRSTFTMAETDIELFLSKDIKTLDFEPKWMEEFASTQRLTVESLKDNFSRQTRLLMTWSGVLEVILRDILKIANVIEPLHKYLISIYEVFADDVKHQIMIDNVNYIIKNLPLVAEKWINSFIRLIEYDMHRDNIALLVDIFELIEQCDGKVPQEFSSHLPKIKDDLLIKKLEA